MKIVFLQALPDDCSNTNEREREREKAREIISSLCPSFSYQINSLQWAQNVGCLKKRGSNSWSLTFTTFFFFTAPRRPRANVAPSGSSSRYAGAPLDAAAPVPPLAVAPWLARDMTSELLQQRQANYTGVLSCCARNLNHSPDFPNAKQRRYRDEPGKETYGVGNSSLIQDVSSATSTRPCSFLVTSFFLAQVNQNRTSKKSLQWSSNTCMSSTNRAVLPCCSDRYRLADIDLARRSRTIF